jgi:rubrerythrin
MTVEQAIVTAIAFETRVRDVYVAATSQATDPAARRVLEVLGREEQEHLDYLESRKAEWERTGHLTPAVLATAIPSPQRLAEGVKRLKERLPMTPDQRAVALKTLRAAEEAEHETSAFYRKMVDTIDHPEARTMFGRFLEIEQGHAAIVAAEIDSVTGLGFWFDTREFDLEAG